MDEKKRFVQNTWRSVFLSVVLILLACGIGLAAETLDVPSVTPLSEMQVSDISMTKPGIPGARFGFIERVGSGEMVISDVLYKTTALTRYYHSYNGTPASISQFPVGTHVGYTFDNGREISVIWINE